MTDDNKQHIHLHVMIIIHSTLYQRDVIGKGDRLFPVEVFRVAEVRHPNDDVV